MNLEQFFTLIYPLVCVTSLSAYVPQIRALANARAPLEGVALSSWMIWLAGNLMTLGYVTFHVRDTMLCLVTGLGTALILTVIVLIIYNKKFRHPPRKDSAA